MRETGTPTIWLQRLVLLVLVSAGIVGEVSAQTPQGAQPNLEGKLIPGMTVWITDSGGREEKARIASVSGDIVTTTTGQDTRRFRTNEISRLQVRDSDSLVNGALMGAGTAVLSGLFLCRLTEPWENCRDDVGPMLRMGAIGAGAGIAIDALIRGRRTIYVGAHGSAQWRVAPIVGRGAGGLQVSIGF